MRDESLLMRVCYQVSVLPLEKGELEGDERINQDNPHLASPCQGEEYG